MTGSPGQIRSLMWLDMTPSWCAKIFQSVFFQILYLVVQYHWYWVSTGQFLLVLWGTWSVWGGNGWYLVLLGQYRAVLVVTWWYWVSLLRYWLVFGDNGQNRAVLVASVIWFQKVYCLHGVNHQIIPFSEKEKVMTDKQTNRQNFLSKTCLLWKGSSENSSN